MKAQDAERKKTIFFDLGNVLIFFSLEKMYDQLASCTKLSPQTLRRSIDEKSLLEKYETGSISSEEIYRIILDLSPHPFTFQEMMHALSDIFTPNTDLWPLVEKLKMQGSKLVLISNTNECHFNYAYSHYPILKLFDKFILSHQVGACKPNRLIFDRAKREAEGQSFYTDDIPAFILAGRAAGLDSEIYTDVPSLKSHLKDRDLL